MDNQDDNKSNEVWKMYPDLAKDFIDQCVEEIDKCGRGYQGTSLKVQSWTRMIKAFSAKYPGVIFNRKMLRDHWDSLKKKYSAWCYLKNEAGHGFYDSLFNAESGLFDFDEYYWNFLIKKRKEVAQFRNAPLEDSDKLRKIFGRASPLTFGESGESNLMMANDALAKPMNNTLPNVERGIGDIVKPFFEGVGFTQEYIPSTPTTRINSQVSNASRCNTGTSKRKRIDRPAEFNITNEDRLAELPLEKEYSLNQCLRLIGDMKKHVDVADDVIYLATVKMSQFFKYRKTFIDLSEEVRLQFLCDLTKTVE